MSYLDEITALYSALPRTENDYHRILMQTLRQLNGVINFEDDKLKNALREATEDYLKIQTILHFALQLQRSRITYIESEIKQRDKYKLYIWNKEEEARFKEILNAPVMHTHNPQASARDKKKKDLKARLIDLGYDKQTAERMAEDAI